MTVFRVNINGKVASLPLGRYDAEKLLYDLGLDVSGAEYEMELDCNNDFLLVLDSDFRGLNRLAHRIDQMDDYERESLSAWVASQDLCTVDDALLASYNLGKIEFHPGFDNDEALGEFALESELFEEYNGLPDEVYNMLDRAKVGAQMREMQGGVFAEGGYLVAEPMDGLEYPPEEPLPWFQVSFSDGQEESAWFDFPLSVEDEQIIKTSFGRDDLRDLGMEYHSLLPQLHGPDTTADMMGVLGDLDGELTRMSSGEIMKYKALLEARQPTDLFHALHLAEDLNHFAYWPHDAAMYGRQCVAGFDADDPLLDFIDYEGYGATMLREDGYILTLHGAMRAGPQSEQAQENEELEFESQGMGGMGAMA